MSAKERKYLYGIAIFLGIIGGIFLYNLDSAKAVILPPEPEILFDWGSGSESNFMDGKSIARDVASTSKRISFAYTPETNKQLCRVSARISTVGLPNGNLDLKIYFGGFEPEAGILLATVSKATSSFPIGFPIIDRTYFALPTCVDLIANNNYFLVFKKDNNTVSATDYYLHLLSIGLYSPIQDQTTTDNIFWHIHSDSSFWTKRLQDNRTIQMDIMLEGVANTDYLYTGFNEVASTSYGFIDEDFGWLGNMVRDVIKFLFIPNQTALDDYKNLYNDLANKPPFGYFTEISIALNSISTSSPLYALADLSTLNTDFFNPIKTIMIMLLWVFFVFVIFNRLKHFEI